MELGAREGIVRILRDSAIMDAFQEKSDAIRYLVFTMAVGAYLDAALLYAFEKFDKEFRKDARKNGGVEAQPGSTYTGQERTVEDIAHRIHEALDRQIQRQAGQVELVEVGEQAS